MMAARSYCYSLIALSLCCLGFSGCGGESTTSQEGVPEAPARVVEADLGSFFVTIRIDEGQRAFFRVQFVGMVDEDYVAEFTELHEQRKVRMRERIESVLQTADVEDLKQPGIPIIKTEVATAVRKVLRTPHLVEVVYSDYSFRQG